MQTYKVTIDVDAIKDIENATIWYNKQLQGLGSRFQKQTTLQINSLKKYAPVYSNRYANVHCMIIKKFPFMVHYTINNELFLVEVFAVIHTSRNPKIWEEKKQ